MDLNALWLMLGTMTASLLMINLYMIWATKRNVTDLPNERSSHTESTIRGGGIVVAASLVCYMAWTGFGFPFLLIGFLIIATLSLIDDLFSLSHTIRLIGHIIAHLLLVIELKIYEQPFGIYLSLVAIIVGIGAMNAYNFMDGVNGITGNYSIVFFGSYGFIAYYLDFLQRDLLFVLTSSLLVFHFYNHRNKAKCFAGDIGSISLGYIIIFMVYQLMIKTNNIGWIALLGVYGIDSSFTIIQRAWNKENILKPHRQHLYQRIVNGKFGISHLQIAAIYSGIQLLVNFILIITFCIWSSLFWLAILIPLLFMGIAYILIKRKIISKPKIPTHVLV